MATALAELGVSKGTRVAIQMPKLPQLVIAYHAVLHLGGVVVLTNPIYFIRFREFEAPMAGGVHLANRFPELQEYFEEDREMLFYGSMEELVDKARFYLAPERDTERRQIGQRAAARARAEHTWLHRFRRIGDVLGLDF